MFGCHGAESTGVMSWSLRPVVACLFTLCAIGTPLHASAQQGDARDAARAAAIAGRRSEAVDMLKALLAETPRDVDARLLLGVVLSWEGRYDEATAELRQVLEQSPTYNDARVALANVAWWTGRYDQLRELAVDGRSQRPYDVEWMMQEARALDGLGRRREARDAVISLLARQPGHVQGRSLKDRLDARLRPWEVTMGVGGDRFSDGTTPWSESYVSVNRRTAVGTVIGRMSRAERFGYSDRLVEVEAYPKFRPGTYGFVSFGMSQDDTLYPNWRMAADLYQSLGRGFEGSIGMRRLSFSSPTDIYIATGTKYLGNWMLTAKVVSVPDIGGDEDSMSYHGVVRRYIRGDGISFVGAGYSRGFSREEVADRAELQQLGADTYRANVDLLFGRITLSASGSTSRQERVRRGTLWQHSFGTSVSVQF